MERKSLGILVRGLAVFVLVPLGSAERAIAQTLSPQTSCVFVADGNICEFINVGGDCTPTGAPCGDSQEYFVTNSGSPNFGDIKAAANLAKGVLVGLDIAPAGDPNFSPRSSGFQDKPGSTGATPLPTGFNNGRMFVSYNPAIDAYFIALDVSAPAALDPLLFTQPIAFDLDGDGNVCTLTEINAAGCAPLNVTEAPTLGDDIYRVLLDLNGDFINDVRVQVVETTAPVPAGAVLLTRSCAALTTISRYLSIEPLGAGAINAAAFANKHLDSNMDGVADAGVVGVGADVEFMISNVSTGCTGTGCANDPFLTRNQEPCCVTFTSFVDSNDDDCLGGGAEDSITIHAVFPCPDIEVIKMVRCADGSNRPFDDVSHAQANFEHEFEVTIQNWGNSAFEHVRINPDLFSCVSPATASLVANSCTPAGPFCTAFQAAFLVGTPFTVDAGTLSAADPEGCETDVLGQTFTFRFRVRVAPTDNLAFCDNNNDCTNAITVTGETFEIDPLPDDQEEPPGAGDEFTVIVDDNAGVIDTDRENTAGADDNVAHVEIECRGVSFSKEIRLFSDANGAPPPQPGSFAPRLVVATGDVTFPIILEYKYTFSNTGENAETAMLSDPALCSDVGLAGGSFVAGQCALCPSGTFNFGSVPPVTGMAMTTCRVQFDTAAELTAFTALDDARTTQCGTQTMNERPLETCYSNCATVNSSLTDAGDLICDTPVRLDDFATVCVEQECTLTVTKQVACLDACTNGSPILPYVDKLEAIPGACAQFRIDVNNTGAVPIPLVCITDSTTCSQTISGRRADIRTTGGGFGTDVTANFASFATDGVRRCFIPSTPIGVGQTLVITYNVTVGATSCQDSVLVEGYEETTPPTPSPRPDVCRDDDSAAINPRIPSISCDKTVQADLGNNGGAPDFGPAAAIDLDVLEAVDFPIKLTYTFTAHNTGTLSLNNVQVCDGNLVADATACGIAVGPCALNTAGTCTTAGGSACANIGALGAGVVSAPLTCVLLIADQAQYDCLDLREGGDDDCYNNTARACGEVGPICAPPGFDRTIESSPCRAQVCSQVIVNKPETKAKFDIWNENEVRFSGTERCIISWDQRMLSEYTGGNIANHFLRGTLQTNKGRARIDGVGSPVVCSDSSAPCPLLGVAAKLINFGRAGVDWAGTNLHGTGTEVGAIYYDLVPGDGGERGGGLPDDSARSGISKKGSLLVYTKVEIKFDNQGRPIQDTFISLKNDFAGDVRVQLYLVNGDQPTPPIVFNGQVIERAHLGCNNVDQEITLTGDQPIYWSALTGNPRGISPFTILDPGPPPGRPDRDPRNPGGRVIRGYVLAWAVNSSNQEIRWNHLLGDVVIINYLDQSAWEYNSWNFAAVADVAQGEALLPPLGQLDLDGVEYDYAPNQLLLDFYASGAVILSNPQQGFLVDTDLTLWISKADLRQDAGGGAP